MQRKITYDDIEEPGITAEEKSHRSWLFYLGKDSSIITDLFLGQFRSTLKCSECDHESVTFEPFWLVSLPLSKDCVDLHQCMELFVKAETLGGDEMPTCEECKERRKCVKWYVQCSFSAHRVMIYIGWSPVTVSLLFLAKIYGSSLFRQA